MTALQKKEMATVVLKRLIAKVAAMDEALASGNGPAFVLNAHYANECDTWIHTNCGSLESDSSVWPTFYSDEPDSGDNS